MPEQRFVIDGREIIVDPATLSEKARNNLLTAVKKTHEYAVETRPGMPGVKVPGLNSPGGNSIMDMLMTQEGPGMNARKLEELKPRLMGGAIGSVAGPVGAAMGMASPPTTVGEGLGMLAGGTAGKLMGPGVQAMKGIKGILGAGAAGLAENVVQQGGEMAGQVATGNPAQGNPKLGWNTAISAMLPMGAKGLLQAPAAAAIKMGQTPDALGDNTKDVLSKIMGKEITDPAALRVATDAVTPPTNAAGKNLLSPFGRVYGKVMNQAATAVDNQTRALDEAKNFHAKLVDTVNQGKTNIMSMKNLAAQNKRARTYSANSATQQLDDMEREVNEPFIQQAVDSLYMSTKDMQEGFEKHVDEINSKVATAVEGRAKIFAGRRQRDAIKKGLSGQDGPLAVSVAEPFEEENLQRMIESEKVKVMQDFQKAQQYDRMQVKPLQRAMSKNPEVDPNLMHFVNKNIKNVDDFQKAMDDADPTNLLVLRKALGGTDDPNKLTPAIKAFEEGFTRQFAKLSLGPDGTLSNIKEAAKKYDFNKIKAIYGGGQRGDQYATRFQKMVDSTMNLMADQANDKTGAKVMEMKNIGSVPYIILRGAMGNATNPLKAIGRGLAGAGATAVALNWNKMIDYAVHNEKFGHEVEEWIANKSVDKTLRYYPLVEKYFRQNNEYQPKEK